MFDLKLEEAQALVGALASDLVEGLEAARRAGLKASAARLRDDGQALRQEHERLEQRLGPGHPDLVALESAIAEIDLLGALDEATARRADARPRPAVDAWTLEGRVSGTRGAPAVGVTVRFTDAEGRFTADLGTARTDEEGEFFRVYNQAAHRDLFAARPDVFVEVLDAAGRVRLRSAESAKVEPGSIAFLDVRLPATGTGGGGTIPRPQPPRPSPPPARPTQRRRPAS